MLHNKKMILFTLLIISVLPSCSTWHDTLRKSAGPIKDYWVKLVNGKWDYFKRYGVIINDTDVPKIKLISTEVFKIDSASLMNYEEEDNPKKYMKLDKNYATTFILKNDSVFGVISAKYQDKTWQNYWGYGYLPGFYSNKIDDLNRKGIRVYSLRIYVSPHSFIGWFIYKENGQYMAMTNWAQLGLLKNYLFKLKDEQMQPNAKLL